MINTEVMVQETKKWCERVKDLSTDRSHTLLSLCLAQPNRARRAQLQLMMRKVLSAWFYCFNVLAHRVRVFSCGLDRDVISKESLNNNEGMFYY